MKYLNNVQLVKKEKRDRNKFNSMFLNVIWLIIDFGQLTVDFEDTDN